MGFPGGVDPLLGRHQQKSEWPSTFASAPAMQEFAGT
jgi:hypothetical protein